MNIEQKIINHLRNYFSFAAGGTYHDKQCFGIINGCYHFEFWLTPRGNISSIIFNGKQLKKEVLK